MAPALMRKESTYGVSRIQRGHPVHHHRAHYQGWNGAASTLVCQRHDLNGILSSAPGQVYLIFILLKYQILVLFYGSSNYCNPTPFVRLILGSLASNVHCQGYLLEGLSREPGLGTGSGQEAK